MTVTNLCLMYNSVAGHPDQPFRTGSIGFGRGIVPYDPRGLQISGCPPQQSSVKKPTKLSILSITA